MTRYDYAMLNSDDPAVRARARGPALAYAMTPGQLNDRTRAWIAEGDSTAWHLHVDPATGGWKKPGTDEYDAGPFTVDNVILGDDAVAWATRGGGLPATA